MNKQHFSSRNNKLQPADIVNKSLKELLLYSYCVVSGDTLQQLSWIALTVLMQYSFVHTGWLKVKCPTGQNTISQQPIEILTKISGFKDKDFPTSENWQRLDEFKYLNNLCYFSIYADEHFDNCYFFLILLKRKTFFCKTKIIMTLSNPDKAKVKAEHYAELCYAD